MYLSQLRIAEGLGDGREIRRVSFKRGLNIVVDETPVDADDDGRGNNVGKTTFLRIIDICLGANDKKYIWTDGDTGSETTTVRNYINQCKVYAELDVQSADSTFTLKVELFDRGKRFINGLPLTYGDYVDALNNRFFAIPTSPPSFRQLIGKFVRIKQSQDTQTFLRYLHPNTTIPQYRNIYDFLFKLSSQEDSANKLLLNQTITQLEKDIGEILRLHKFANIDDIRERIRIVRNSVAELERKIESAIGVRDYERKMHALSAVSSQLNNLNDAIGALSFKAGKIEGILREESEAKDDIDESILLDLYQDVNQLVGPTSSNFKELIEFNKRIRENKVKYYQARLGEVDAELSSMAEQRRRLIDENEAILSVINSDNYADFDITHRELIKQSELLGELTKVEQIYAELTTDLDSKKSEYSTMESTTASFDNLSKFNEYFTRYTNEVLGQRLYLTRENSFPLKLSNVEEGVGTGHRKTITLLMDIAYVAFISELGLPYPKFFVHDVLETVDQYNLRKIVGFINESESQFVFAVLNEKIRDYSFIHGDDKVLRLSSTNKLFGI